jgi:putative RNA 2'-phosphotransferase
VSNSEQDVRSTSKFLSLVLRHQPQKIGIELDSSGWTSIEGLIEAMRRNGKRITREQLDHVVATNDKQRFVISEDGTRIRANQGHSVEVDLGYEPASPPEFLIHGTPSKSVEAIRREGLKKMNRHHVHMHADSSVARAVGARRGAPVLLRIRSQEMAQAGFVFYVSANQVWLTDHVPPEFIDFPET